MRRAWTTFAWILATAGTASAEPRGVTTILDCNFDAKAIDRLIGFGGPDVGEPVSLNGVAATVRSAPLPTPSVELTDTWGIGARHLRFEFTDGAEITSGVLSISMSLYFEDSNAFAVNVREQGFSHEEFLNLSFLDDTSVRFGDMDTPFGATIGHYTAGSAIPLVLTFDLDARTYDVALDGALLRTDESFGTTTRGIGSVLIGLENDIDADGTCFLDDLVATATQVPTAVEPSGWGSTKARFR